MIPRVINLDRAADRMARFTVRNVDQRFFERFAAVDGRALVRDHLLATGFLRPENSYSSPALGIAMSHVALWREAVASGSPMLICEDDAILRRDFDAVSARLMAAAPDWDMIAWGYNLDWPVVIDAGGGLDRVMLHFDQEALRHGTDAFMREGTAPSLFRLRSNAGSLCYTVSPAGARKLLDLCLPLGNQHAAFGGARGHGWINTGIDVEVARHCNSGHLHALACFPPIAASENDHGVSSNHGGT